VKVNTKIKNITDLVIVIILISNIFFYDALRLYVSAYAKYSDELIVATFLFLSAIFVLCGRGVALYKEEKQILLLIVVVSLIGWISSIIYQYQQCPKGIIYDFIVFIKAFCAYFTARLLLQKINLHSTYTNLTRYLLLVFVFIVIFYILDIFFNIFPGSDVRYGLHSVQLFFSHPSRFAFAITTIFVLTYPFLKGKNLKLVSLAILLFGALSLRYKYFGFMFFSLLLLFVDIEKKKITFENSVPFLLAVFVAIILIAYNQITYYYSKESYDKGITRSVLTVTSFEIARDAFPIGSGYASFASYYSGVFYSDIYEKYEINEIEGINEYDISFIADTYWPMVIGQFGFVGAGLMLIIIFNFYRLIIKLFLKSEIMLKRYYVSAILLLTALCIDSTSDAIFSQNRGVISFIILAMLINLSSSKPNGLIGKK